MQHSVKIALIQASPVVNDLSKSLQLLENLLSESADKGAQLVVFGETWLCGYPAWLDHCPGIGIWDAPATKEAFEIMHANSLDIESAEFRMLSEIISKSGQYVVLGANEKCSKHAAHGTLYNSIFMFGPDGTLLNHHRKLMPTFTEKLLYGLGDGAGLKSIDTSFGKLSASICWEHWMPHVRQALHNSGEHIHIALWPDMHERHELASRHYAFEGRCFVVAMGQIQHAGSFPKGLDKPRHLENPKTQVLKGGSCVIGPDGRFILEPVYGSEEIIYTELEPASVIKERMTLDVSGHYNRTDIFEFKVHDTRK